MVYSNPGYCACGYEVWIEFLWTGEEWIHRFHDADNQEIEECPGCGKVLHEDELESL